MLVIEQGTEAEAEITEDYIELFPGGPRCHKDSTPGYRLWDYAGYQRRMAAEAKARQDTDEDRLVERIADAVVARLERRTRSTY